MPSGACRVRISRARGEAIRAPTLPSSASRDPSFDDLVEPLGGERPALDPAALDRQDLSLVGEILEDLGQLDRVARGVGDGRRLAEGRPCRSAGRSRRAPGGPAGS